MALTDANHTLGMNMRKGTRTLEERPSQHLDELIMGTNSSSIVSKRSVERIYYPNESHYFRYFVKKFQRRAPLINRGYWLRLRAIDETVRRFLVRHPPHRRVIINLGCGSDVLPWQCHARHQAMCDNVLFVDVDYPDLMRKKREIVLATPQLRELLGTEVTISDTENDQILLQTPRYCQIGCDLRELDKLRQTLTKLTDIERCHVMFVAEVSITYMDTYSADNLVQWASTVGKAEFCLLEQILPEGPDHPFSRTMLRHFEKLKTPPRSVHKYQTLCDQKARFKDRGWQRVDVWDLWQVWSNEGFVRGDERASLDLIEPFDEWEELILFARHYFLIHAVSSAPQCNELSSTSTETTKRATPYQIQVSILQPEGPKRRFGTSLSLSDPHGRKFGFNLMGLDVGGRTNSYDIFSFHGQSRPREISGPGPAPRMCHTLTDLGDFGFLLVGGRNSPTNSMSDCWLLSKGKDCVWSAVPSLPTPLFRHSSTRLRGTSLVLIIGGKTGPSRLSEKHYLFHPHDGWLECTVIGQNPKPTFGNFVCNTSTTDNSTGVFKGLLAGGIGQEGSINDKVYLWKLDTNMRNPTIRFEKYTLNPEIHDSLALFGSESIDMATYTLACGGVGFDASVQGQSVITVAASHSQMPDIYRAQLTSDAQKLPFMVGSSIVKVDDNSLFVAGGGATCFSMGTYWETGIYQLSIRNELQNTPESSQIQAKFLGSPKRPHLGIVSSHNTPPPAKAAMTSVTRVQVTTAEQFTAILDAGIPVIMENLDIGGCVERWNPFYMTEKVGSETKVSVHECPKDLEAMDFNAKNFRYVTESFGKVMSRCNAGEKLYLRSLSMAKRKESPANLANDFPGLAGDFRIPAPLEFVEQNLFSSVLRVSGKVNMWLHYDVMANVYAQVTGCKRLVLFPPHDVRHLEFAPGASSSSIDIFSALDTPRLGATSPQYAILKPGDVLFLPALWLHTGQPISDASVAVNVFFRDLKGGYAIGRDVYGNRDLAAYEKGRIDTARITKSFQQIPIAMRRFYLGRLASELDAASEEV